MKITLLKPSTWNPSEALTKLLQGSSIESSQGLSDLFILATIYLGCAFFVGALILTLRSCWRTIRYRRRLRGIKEYSSARESLGGDGSFPLFREFNHHLVDVPKQDGSGDMVLRRSLDAEEIFTDDRFAPGLSSNRIFQALPGILTGLGVLGTFVGLQLGIGGLSDGDPSKIETSKIMSLIQGCSVAFSTSVWGVAASLVFSFLEKLLEGFAIGGVRKLQRRIDTLVPRYVPEEAMAELARSSRGAENLLKGLAVEIGGQMQVAVREGVAETLRQEISSAAGKVVEAIQKAFGQHAEGLGKDSAKVVADALGQELGKISGTIDSLNTTVGLLRESSEGMGKAVTDAVGKLNAHENVMSSMGEVSERLKQASETFAAMNDTLEASAARNKEAADAQHSAASANQEVAVKFGAIGERLPEVRQAIEQAAAVIVTIGGPIAKLEDLLGKLHEMEGELQGKRDASEEERSTRLLALSKDLAGTVGKAVEEFAKVGAIAQQLGDASTSLEEASNELAVFGQQVLQASQEQRAASEASREAAAASKLTTEALKPMPEAFKDLSLGLADSGGKLRQGIEAASESQRLWLKGVEAQLLAQRDSLNAVVASYRGQLEGQTKQLIDQWTTAVSQCLESYSNQVDGLQDGLDALMDELGKIKNNG